MKPLLLIPFIVAMFASCRAQKLASDEVILASLVGGELSPSIASAVPLEDRAPFGEAWLESIAPPIADAERVSVLTRSLLDGEIYDIGKTPFIGHLCHVALLDSSEDVVAIVSIINSEARCTIGNGSRDSQRRIRNSPVGKRVAVQSDDFLRVIYDHLKLTNPKFLRDQKNLYNRGGHAIDQPALRTKQGGDGQPASAVALRSESHEKPKPESKMRPQ